MRNPFRRRPAEPSGAIRTRRSAVYFCATCAVSEGEEHLEWCHRQGVMSTSPDALSGGEDSEVHPELVATFRRGWDPDEDDQHIRNGLAAVMPQIVGPWRTAQAIDSEVIADATRLLKYALHLRTHGERAPGGNETWALFDRECEHFLRNTRRRPTDGGEDRG